METRTAWKQTQIGSIFWEKTKIKIPMKPDSTLQEGNSAVEWTACSTNPSVTAVEEWATHLCTPPQLPALCLGAAGLFCSKNSCSHPFLKINHRQSEEILQTRRAAQHQDTIHLIQQHSRSVSPAFTFQLGAHWLEQNCLNPLYYQVKES